MTNTGNCGLPLLSLFFIFFPDLHLFQLRGRGKLFNTAFGLDYRYSLFLTAGIVVFYALMGGFAAVC